MLGTKPQSDENLYREMMGREEGGGSKRWGIHTGRGPNGGPNGDPNEVQKVPVIGGLVYI